MCSEVVCGVRRCVERGSVWREMVCGVRRCVEGGSVWSEAVCGVRQQHSLTLWCASF